MIGERERRGRAKRGKRRNERDGDGDEDTSLALGFAGHLLTFHGGGTAGAPSSAPRRNFARPRAPPDTHDRCRTRISPTLLFFSFSLTLSLSLSSPFPPRDARARPHTNIKCNGSARCPTTLLSLTDIDTAANRVADVHHDDADPLAD